MFEEAAVFDACMPLLLALYKKSSSAELPSRGRRTGSGLYHSSVQPDVLTDCWSAASRGGVGVGAGGLWDVHWSEGLRVRASEWTSGRSAA